MPLAREIGGGPSGGREMQGGQPAGQQAIHLLRKRLREIARAQSCIHMAYRNAVVEGGQGRGQRGGRITLYQYAVRCLRLQDRFKRFQDTRGERGKRLVGTHRVEIMVGCYLEGRQHLIEHIAVLGRHADACSEIARA